MLISFAAFSQVAIGKASVSNTAVSLEFGSQEARGIVLPYVTNAAAVSPVEGSIIFDSNDKKVKFFNGSWKDLTMLTNGTVDLAPQNALIENTAAKATVGTPTNTDGILVLEDTNKAMILPKVTNPHTAIKSPAAGMMVYDNTKKLLCIFNGTEWTYWKPENY